MTPPYHRVIRPECLFSGAKAGLTEHEILFDAEEVVQVNSIFNLVRQPRHRKPLLRTMGCIESPVALLAGKVQAIRVDKSRAFMPDLGLLAGTLLTLNRKPSKTGSLRHAGEIPE
jgi:hypothetical protein